MSRAKVVSLASVIDVEDSDAVVQAVHLERAADAVERILLVAYDQCHDDAARVLVDILDRLRVASQAVGTR